MGEERPVRRLLKSSRWGVMATYTRVVGVEVMRSLWDIFSRQSEKDVLMAWKSDVRKRQASKTVLVLGQSNCADGGAVY